MAVNSAVVGNLRVLLSMDTTNFDKGALNSEANVKKLADRLQKDLVPSQQKINALIRDFAGNQDIRRALEMATAVEKIGGATKLTAAEQQRANKVVQEAIDKYRVLGREAPKELLDLANATKQVKKPTDDLNTSVSSLMGKARSLAGVFGVTLGAGALVGFAKHTFDAADQVGDLAAKMGVSVEAAQRFGFAARQSGADIENISQSIVTMNRNLADGDKSTVNALAAAGLKFQDIRAMKPEEAFRTIADAIGQIPDPMLQSKVAMELFGKAGAELLPMIRENSLKAADGVRVMSAETVQHLKDAKQAWENFWNDITIASANSMSQMLTTYGAFLRLFGQMDISKIAMSMTPNAMLFGGKGIVELIAGSIIGDQSKNQFDPNDPAAVRAAFMRAASGPAGTFKTKEQIEAEERQAKEAAAAQKRLNEAYAEFERHRLTGLTDQQRRIQQFEDRFLRERGLLEKYRAMGALVSRNLSMSLLPGGLPDLTQPSAMVPIDFKLPGQVGFDDRLDTFQRMLAENFRINTTPTDPVKLSSLIRGGLGGALNLLPQTVLNALTGGGNLGQSIGSLFGMQLGGSVIGKSTEGIFSSGLGKMLQGGLGNKVGGMIANFIPGLGALLGPALSKAFSWIGGIGQNTTLKDRQKFAEGMGFENLNALLDKLKSMGGEGGKLADFAAKMIGRKDEAGNRKWMKDVTAFFDRLEKVPGKVNELSSALGKFGGVIPKSLEPMLDALLGSSALSADVRAQLEGMKKPTWQTAMELAQSFGVNTGALGGAFNQARVADSAFQIKRAMDVFGKFAGADQDAILRDMADELSGVANEAKKSNVALPNAIRDFIMRVDAMGLLLDENGERIDSSLLTFAEIQDEYEKQVVSLLEQIRDLLGGKAVPGVGVGAGGTGELGVIRDPRQWIRDEITQPFQMPSFAGGTHGAFMDFGAGTPVMLHGRERVMTTSEGRGGTFNIYAIDAPSFETFLKRRGGADAIARTLPDAASRYVGVRA